MTHMKNLLVIGAACADVMLRLDHLPITGEDINLQAQDIAMGGCGYNAAMCAFANGIDVTLLSPVGTSGIYRGKRLHLLSCGTKR